MNSTKGHVTKTQNILGNLSFLVGVLLAVAGGICAVLGSGDNFEQFKNLVPIVVVLISIPLGRYPTMMHLVAGALIISGVLYLQIRNLRKDPE